MARLVAESARLARDPKTGEILERSATQPALPPRTAQRHDDMIGLSAVKCGRDSRADVIAGAEGPRLKITTATIPWSDAAHIPFHLVEREWYWLELSAQVHSGQVAIAIRTGMGEPKHEQVIAAGKLETFTIAFSHSDTGLLIRNASVYGASVVEIRQVTAYAMSIPVSDGASGQSLPVTHG